MSHNPLVCPPRFRRLLRYIDEHLQSELSIDQLSEVACCSRFHFQRQFAAWMGLSVGEYVRLCRLKRASLQLAFRQLPVTSVALDCGYQAPESFSRAFTRLTGQAPRQFRLQPDWPGWASHFDPLSRHRSRQMKPLLTIEQVDVVEVPAIWLAVLEHHGDPRLLGDSIRRFIRWRQQHGLSPQRHATYNLFYNDPEQTPAAAFRLDIAVAVPQPVSDSAAGIVSKLLPGGRCARLRHVGSDDGLGAAIQFLYGQWLVQSGESLRDFPLYCQRLRFFPDVAEHEAELDLYLPLAPLPTEQQASPGTASG